MTTKKEVIDFLGDTNLLDNIVKVIQSTGVIKENKPIKAEVLIITGKKVKNKSNTSTNIHPEDETSVGKDHVTEHAMKIAFYKDWEIYHIPSPTAITYGQRKQEMKVNDEKMFKRERNPITNDTIIYIKDASEKFLNGDDAKILFEGDVDITRTIDSRSCHISWKKPVVIVTTADTYTSNQLLRRIPSLPFDTTTGQTKLITDQQWQSSCKLIEKQKSSMNIIKKQEIAKAAFYELKDVFVDVDKVCNYAKDKLPECNLVVMRTLNKRLIDFIKFSTSLHQFQRKQIGMLKYTDGKEYPVFEATIQDVDIGFEIFNYIYYTEFADVSFLNKRQRNIHLRLKDNPNERFSIYIIKLWKESEGVSRQTTYADLTMIVRADPAVMYDETIYPKGFYYSSNPASDDEEKKVPDVPKLKELKEFCKDNYDENDTVGYTELTEHFSEQFIGDVIQSGLLSEVTQGRYYYEEVVG